MSEKKHDWLAQAKTEWRGARDLLHLDLDYAGMTAYYAQQSAEKALKAYVEFSGQSIFRTHDILFLINQCSKVDIEFLQCFEEAKRLNPFIVKTRYPDDGFALSHQEALELLDDAAKILDFVDKKIKAGEAGNMNIF